MEIAEGTKMWWYENVTRVDFEAVKDMIEQIMFRLGASKYEIHLTYEVKQQAVQMILKKCIVLSDQYLHIKDYFFRVDEVLFSKKPFIVIECGDLDELMNNIMDDAEPFPYDLSYEELCDEVKYSLGIEPYPQE